MAKGKDMGMNGVSINSPGLLSRPLAMEALRLPEKRPKIWGQALSLARMARGWSVKDLVNHAARDVTPAIIKRWEIGDDRPKPRQMDVLRKFLPSLHDFDDLLPVDLRADPGQKRKQPRAEPPELAEVPSTAEITRWVGPMPPTFGRALAFCREKAGLGQRDLALEMGVAGSTISNWEADRGGGGKSSGTQFRMILEVYEKLCDFFPMLAYGPKPPFSPFFTSQKKTERFIEAKEQRGDKMRAQHITEEALKEAARLHAEANKPKVVDEAPANYSGAQYGVLAAKVAGLKAKIKTMQAQHIVAIERLKGDLGDAEKEMMAAELEMERVANEVHGDGGVVTT